MPAKQFLLGSREVEILCIQQTFSPEIGISVFKGETTRPEAMGVPRRAHAEERQVGFAIWSEQDGTIRKHNIVFVIVLCTSAAFECLKDTLRADQTNRGRRDMIAFDGDAVCSVPNRSSTFHSSILSPATLLDPDKSLMRTSLAE